MCVRLRSVRLFESSRRVRDHERMSEDDTRGSRDPAESRFTRSQAAEEQDRRADDRDRTAEDRDRVSEAHDLASENREERADARDRRAEARDQATNSFDVGASSDRAGARRDRRGAAGDRSHAADDREAASTDRVLSAREREASSIDDLTGAHRRDAGLVELQREIDRAKRTQTLLTLAFVDVDGLKLTNDTLGHAAGDRLLCRVVDTMRDHMRSYDLIVRFGGDEFLCALPELTIAKAAERFVLINADLAGHPHASITSGLADLQAHDSLDDLIARADSALRAERHQRSTARA